MLTPDSSQIPEATLSDLCTATDEKEDLALPLQYTLTPMFLFTKEMYVEKMHRYCSQLL